MSFPLVLLHLRESKDFRIPLTLATGKTPHIFWNFAFTHVVVHPIHIIGSLKPFPAVK